MTDVAELVERALEELRSANRPAALTALHDLATLEVVEAVVALGFIGAPGTLEQIVGLVGDPDPGVRDALARTLASCQTEEDVLGEAIVRPLLVLAEDADPEVRWSAMWELAGFGPGADAVRAALDRGCRSDDPRLGRRATEGIARLDAM